MTEVKRNDPSLPDSDVRTQALEVSVSVTLAPLTAPSDVSKTIPRNAPAPRADCAVTSFPPISMNAATGPMKRRITVFI